MKQVNLDGMTGRLQFNEHGERKGIQLETLNLRNNSFKKVGSCSTIWVIWIFNLALNSTKREKLRKMRFLPSFLKNQDIQ